jgi:ABC-type antimicrobial peptide transport system permease subunit
LLLGVFAVVALLLSAVGTYGVISQAVGERISEFGVRLALGAAPEQLRALVVRFGLRLAAVSALVGIPAALAFGRVLSRLFVGVDAANPLIYAGVAVGLGLTALAAALVPARRASRVDPIVALRTE